MADDCVFAERADNTNARRDGTPRNLGSPAGFSSVSHDPLVGIGVTLSHSGF